MTDMDKKTRAAYYREQADLYEKYGIDSPRDWREDADVLDPPTLTLPSDLTDRDPESIYQVAENISAAGWNGFIGRILVAYADAKAEVDS